LDVYALAKASYMTPWDENALHIPCEYINILKCIWNTFILC